MKTVNKQNTLAVVFVGLPLLIMGGCASTDPIKVASTDAFAQMDGEHGVMEVSEYEIDVQELLPIDEAVLESADAQIESPMKSKADMPATGDATIDDSVQLVMEVALPATPKPESGLISFAFDQSIIDAQYGEMLWQHAQYLKENENLVLVVSGHTDSSGAKKYNDMLSEKRAKQVASILIEFGVPAQRIKVSGSGSDQPLLGAITHRDHRRVELDYQDQQIVSN